MSYQLCIVEHLNPHLGTRIYRLWKPNGFIPNNVFNIRQVACRNAEVIDLFVRESVWDKRLDSIKHLLDQSATMEWRGVACIMGSSKRAFPYS
jgi:hypothetical protein